MSPMQGTGSELSTVFMTPKQNKTVTTEKQKEKEWGEADGDRNGTTVVGGGGEEYNGNHLSIPCLYAKIRI